MRPLEVETSAEELLSAAAQWVALQPRMQVIHKQPGLLHVRAVSLVSGFADDMLISVRCGGQKMAILEVQSMLRLGKGDFGEALFLVMI